MEEILASIRRIISEDGDEAEEEAAEPEAGQEPELEPTPEPEAEPEPVAEEEEEDVLDLSDMEDEDEEQEDVEPLFDEQRRTSEEPEAEPEPEPEPEPAFEPEPEYEHEPEPAPAPAYAPPPPSPPRPAAAPEGLVSPPQAQETVHSFAELQAKLNEDYQELPVGNGAVTLERLTRELMRPMLKDWLDQHLPSMVERLVREEIERLVMLSQRRDRW